MKFLAAWIDNKQKWTGQLKCKIRIQKMTEDDRRYRRAKRKEGKARFFFQWFEALWWLNTCSIKRRVRSQLATSPARSTFTPDQFWKLRKMWIQRMPLWRATHISKSTSTKHNIGSWAIEKAHAIVALAGLLRFSGDEPWKRTVSCRIPSFSCDPFGEMKKSYGINNFFILQMDGLIGKQIQKLFYISVNRLINTSFKKSIGGQINS